MSSSSYSSWPDSVSQWHAHSGVVVVQSPNSPQTEAKETLDSVPIELLLYSSPVVVATLLVPTQPDPPPPPFALQSRLSSPLLTSLHSKRPNLPPPGPARLCSPIPLPPLWLRSVLEVPGSSMSVNLHWPPVSKGIQPMPGWLPPTLSTWAPQRLGSHSLTVPLVALESHGGGEGPGRRRRPPMIPSPKVLIL